MDYRKNQHSVFMLIYHAVFVVKYRRKVITPEIMDFIRSLVARLMTGFNGSLIELNGEPDHIHILFELPPMAAPARIVGSLKTQISKEVRARYKDEIISKLWGEAFWSESYFITTTGGASIATIEQYIQNQGIVREKRKYVRKST